MIGGTPESLGSIGHGTTPVEINKTSSEAAPVIDPHSAQVGEKTVEDLTSQPPMSTSVSKASKSPEASAIQERINKVLGKKIQERKHPVKSTARLII